jgi:hypothetical protein
MLEARFTEDRFARGKKSYRSAVGGQQPPEIRSRISDFKIKQLRRTTNNGQATILLGIAFIVGLE